MASNSWLLGLKNNSTSPFFIASKFENLESYLAPEKHYLQIEGYQLLV